MKKIIVALMIGVYISLAFVQNIAAQKVPLPNSKVTPVPKAKLKMNPLIIQPKINRLKTISSSRSAGFNISRTRNTARSSKSNPETSESNGQYCTSRNVNLTESNFEKIVTGNQSDKIYPGAFYTLNSILDGSYTPVNSLQRRPVSLVANLIGGSSGRLQTQVTEPTMGNITESITELIRNNSSVINAANYTFRVEEIFSEEQLRIMVQGDYAGFGTEVSAAFNFQSRNKKHSYLARLTQVFFTVNVDYTRPLIDGTASENDIYVSKVSYGRIGYLKIESDSSYQAISAALSFAYSGSGSTVGVQAEVEHQRTLASSSIVGFFLGGDPTNAVDLTSVNSLSQFNDYYRRGLRWDPNIAIVPVSYELKYLRDNATAYVNMTTSYVERMCENGKGIRLTLKGISIDEIHGGDCSYAWGNVDVEVWELTNGVRSKQIFPIDENFLSRRITRIWDYPNGNTPMRSITNYSAMKNNSEAEMKGVNRIWRYQLNPNKVGTNEIAIIVKCNINTNHKDNDIASLGFHGMNRVETQQYTLRDVLLNNRDPKEVKYGSMIVGPFSSHSRSDRVHQFRAHFSVQADN